MKLLLIWLALLLAGCQSLSGSGLDALQRGDLDAAQRHFEKSWAQDRDPGALNNLGVVLLRRGERVRAVAHFYMAARYGVATGADNLRRLGEPVPAADLTIPPRDAPQQATGSGDGWLALGIALNAFADGYLERQAEHRSQPRAPQRSPSPTPFSSSPAATSPSTAGSAQLRSASAASSTSRAPAPPPPPPPSVFVSKYLVRSDAAQGCRCECVDGLHVNVCSSFVSVPTVCGFRACPPPPPKPAPPGPGPAPPPGTSNCSPRLVIDDESNTYAWRWICQ